MDVALGNDVFIHPALAERHPHVCRMRMHCPTVVFNAIKGPAWLGGALMLQNYPRRWKQGPERGKGRMRPRTAVREQGSAQRAGELSISSKKWRQKLDAWLRPGDPGFWRPRWEDQEFNQGWLGDHGGDPVSKRVLIKPNYQLTNQETAVRGRLFYVATEPTSQPTRRQRWGEGYSALLQKSSFRSLWCLQFPNVKGCK